MPLDLSIFALVCFFSAALLVGFTKTSIQGIGILAVLLMALAFPGKASPGVLLPMLIMADFLAIFYYRRHCDWRLLWALFPATAVGVVMGYFVVDWIPVDMFEQFLGWLILSMLLFGIWFTNKDKAIFKNRIIAWIVGGLAGATSMIANAAGAIFGLYLLQMGLSKERFVGTRAWYFLVLNSFKLPFSAHLGLITVETLKLNLIALPVILIGALLGFQFLKLVNMTMFTLLIRVAIFLAAIRLILF